jgi:tetrahydromethanopterin S-methyltransferase subunit C
MTTSTRQTVFALVNDSYHAERAVFALRDASYNPNNISLLSPNNTSGAEDVKTVNATKAPEGTVTGATTVGILGGIGGFLIGMGALAIPGVGPLIAAGPILAALSGAAVGAAVGGIGGALIGMGVPEYEAKAYDTHVRSGKTLIAVHCADSNEAKSVRNILSESGATDISTVNDR